MKIEITSFSKKYGDWAADLLRKHWHSTKVVSRGIVYHANTLPGFIALIDGKPAGLITYNLKDDDCEIVTLNSSIEKKGIGTALINAVKKTAISKKCARLWLVTTNDNIDAIRFYQKRGFEFVTLYPNAIDQSRRLKPSIPLIGNHGIPIRDEIEFEMKL